MDELFKYKMCPGEKGTLKIDIGPRDKTTIIKVETWYEFEEERKIRVTFEKEKYNNEHN